MATTTVTAQAREGLRELAAERSTPDHQQPPGALGQVEDRFIGEITGFCEALDGGAGGAGTRGDDGFRELERGAGDLDRPTIAEGRFAQEHVNAEIPESPGRVVVAEVGAEVPHALHDSGEVHVRGHRCAPGESRGVVEVGVEPRGAQERLGGDAAKVEAIAAQEVLLHQRHLGAEGGGAGRGDQPGGAGAEDDEVVAGGGLRVRPVRRPHVRQQLGVGGIVREQRGARLGGARGASIATILSHPLRNPARRSPATMAGHSRMRRQRSPER